MTTGTTAQLAHAAATRDFTSLNGSALIAAYNEMAHYVPGTKGVVRFSDRETALRRVRSLADAILKAEDSGAIPVREVDEATPEELGAQALRPSVQEARAASDAAREAPSAAGKRGPARRAVKEAAREEAGKPPRWRTPKKVAASRTAYLPRPGSLQEEMYGLLTREDGVEVEAFCAHMNRVSPKIRVLWDTSNAWSWLRYLFVQVRGYGLDFDGERLRLLVPANEKPASARKAS